MTALIALLLSQIQVSDEGTYRGTARDKVDCRGPGVSCSIQDGGMWQIFVDGGSGGGAVTGSDGGAADDTVLVGNGTVYQSQAMPNCTDTGGNHLNYTASSNSFSCGATGAARSWLAATLPCPQASGGPTCFTPTGTTPGAGTGDHIIFKTVENSSGSDISLNVTDAYAITDNSASLGRFTLATGKSYRMTATFGQVAYSSNNGYLALSWFNADTGVPLGNATVMVGTQFNASDTTGSGTVQATLTTVSQTRVEVRIFSSGGVSAVGVSGTQADAGAVNMYPNAFIEVLP